MTRFGFTARQRFAADAGRVFDVVTDWPRQSAWVPGTRVERLPGPVAAPGERFTGRTRLGPLVLDDPMTVLVRRRPGPDGPGVVVLTKTGAVLGGEVRLEVRALPGGGSVVEWTEHLVALPRALAVLSRLGGPLPGLLGRAAFTAVLRAARAELDA